MSLSSFGLVVQVSYENVLYIPDVVSSRLLKLFPVVGETFTWKWVSFRGHTSWSGDVRTQLISYAGTSIFWAVVLVMQQVHSLWNEKGVEKPQKKRIFGRTPSFGWSAHTHYPFCFCFFIFLLVFFFCSFHVGPVISNLDSTNNNHRHTQPISFLFQRLLFGSALRFNRTLGFCIRACVRARHTLSAPSLQNCSALHDVSLLFDFSREVLPARLVS